MKKLVSLIVLTVFLSVAFTGVAFAAKGGMPEAHGGITGQDFGEDVSDLASKDPAALVAHILEDCLELEVDVMGMPEYPGLPAAHGWTGAQFGAKVSGLAYTNPAALVEHVTGFAPFTDYLMR